ncbi:MAG: zinc ribbon domain-containing protein [Anaerolineae bacterium]
MKTCQNCHTENPVDAVFCSSCGMSLLARAAAGKESRIQDTTNRKAKRMRRIARVLAVIWAAGLTPCNALLWVVVYELTLEQSGVSAFPLPPDGWLILFLILSVTWAPTAIAWRWEAIGGVVLVAAGLLVSLAFGLLARGYLYVGWAAPGGPANLLWAAPFLLQLVAPFLFLAGLPLVAGSLLLASWRRSKESEIHPRSE